LHFLPILSPRSVSWLFDAMLWNECSVLPRRLSPSVVSGLLLVIPWIYYGRDWLVGRPGQLTTCSNTVIDCAHEAPACPLACKISQQANQKTSGGLTSRQPINRRSGLAEMKLATLHGMGLPYGGLVPCASKAGRRREPIAPVHE
jgi:hypothetical protein